LPTEDGIQLDIENCCNMTMCDTVSVICKGFSNSLVPFQNGRSRLGFPIGIPLRGIPRYCAEFCCVAFLKIIWKIVNWKKMMISWCYGITGSFTFYIKLEKLLRNFIFLIFYFRFWIFSYQIFHMKCTRHLNIEWSF